jgi:hypothetical protein
VPIRNGFWPTIDDQDASNRVSLEGVTLSPQGGGAFEIGIRKFEATAIRLKAGPLVLDAGRIAMHELAAHVRIEEGMPRVAGLEAAQAELSDLKVRGPLTFPPEQQTGSSGSHVRRDRPRPDDAAAGQPAAGAWSLEPLAGAQGTIRAEIVDAHLLFDADVTVPIRDGQIDFNATTVEHVGPDSSMGVSRLGLYVDAPNGRSYVYQFSSVPVAGVKFEQRGGMLGSWARDHGKLWLQAFGEGLLLQGPGRAGMGFTEQARELFDRTAVSGDVQLSDGRFTAPGVEAELTGSADGRNAIRLESGAVGRGLTLGMPALSVRNAALHARGARVACDEITGTLVLRASVTGAQLRFALDVSTLKISGLRLHPPRATSA